MSGSSIAESDGSCEKTDELCCTSTTAMACEAMHRAVYLQKPNTEYRMSSSQPYLSFTSDLPSLTIECEPIRSSLLLRQQPQEWPPPVLALRQRLPSLSTEYDQQKGNHAGYLVTHWSSGLDGLYASRLLWHPRRILLMKRQARVRGGCSGS
jgi:hypothetical protein